MARIPYVQKETAPPEVRELYDNFASQFKLRDVPNVVKALANSPQLPGFSANNAPLRDPPKAPQTRPGARALAGAKGQSAH
jgi:hypothetical protein